MPISDNYTQRLGLAELDVYLDTPNNDVIDENIISKYSPSLKLNTKKKIMLKKIKKNISPG